MVTPIVGLEKLYVADLIKDEKMVVEYGKTRYLEGVKEIGLKIKTNSEPYFAENKLWGNEETIEGIDVEIDILDLEKEEEIFLLGHTIAEDGGIIYSENDKAPEVALLFKSNKGNHKGRYVSLFRGTFSLTDENYKGKEGKTTYQSKKLKATFAPLKSNGMWKYKIDEEEGMTDEKFFEKVIIPKKKQIEKIENN